MNEPSDIIKSDDHDDAAEREDAAAAPVDDTAFEALGEEEYLNDPRGRKRCTALNRAGRRCARFAVMGHDKCRRHGFRLHERRLLAQAKYAQHLGDIGSTTQTLFLKFLDDPDLCDLREELALQRVLLAKFLDLCGRDPNALSRPAASVAITTFNDAIGRLADRVHSMEKRGEGWFSLAQVEYVCDSIVDILARHVKDPNVLSTVATELEACALSEAEREVALAYRSSRAIGRSLSAARDAGGGAGQSRGSPASLPDGAGDGGSPQGDNGQAEQG